MPIFKRGCVVLLLISASACSGSNPSPTAPSTPSAATSTFHVTGIATDDDGNPVAGANITVQPWVDSAVQKSVPAVVVVTDGAGFYRLDFDANRDRASIVATVKAESPGHETAYYNIRQVSTSQNASQNINLYRIKRISAGESIVMTVLPSDTLCGSNSSEFVCRYVHIVAPSDGLMTIEVVPTPSAGGYSLGMQVVGGPGVCCDNPLSIRVTAGAEVVANFGVFYGWTLLDSQSFPLNTSLVRP